MCHTVIEIEAALNTLENWLILCSKNYMQFEVKFCVQNILGTPHSKHLLEIFLQGIEKNKLGTYIMNDSILTL
jgi:hypothetical protein